MEIKAIVFQNGQSDVIVVDEFGNAQGVEVLEGDKIVPLGNRPNCKEPKWDEATQDFIEGAVIVVDLEALKEAKFSEIGRSAEAALKSFKYDGLTFENSGESKVNLNFALNQITADPQFSIPWRALNGTYKLGERNTIILDATNINTFMMTMIGYNQSVLGWQTATEDALAFTTTIEEVEAISTEYNG